jgi:pimeloyl-ACP methyl ester carboxylesterase
VRRKFRLALGAVLLAAAGAGGMVAVARSGLLKPDVATMRARYGLPNSRYATIAGQSVHYVDEGQGPAVVLVHGSYASLRMWDQWAAALKGRYRVIRFDRPRMGLSGPSPDGRTDGVAEAQFIAAFADTLKLDRFAIVGTSSSGESVAHYAATHPDRISAIILANVAAGPMSPGPNHFTAWDRLVLAVDPWFDGWHPQAFWRGILRENYADPGKVTPALVREWTALNNQFQGAAHAPRPGGGPPFAGTPADLAAIHAPALALWSDSDPELPLEIHGRLTLQTLASTDKQLQVVAHCGHMMPLECGGESARLAASFLDHHLLIPAR